MRPAPANPSSPVHAGALLGDPLCLLALGLGAGCSPRAPGTAGTGVGVAAYVIARHVWPSPSLLAWIAVVGVLAGVGVWLCGYAARRLGVHDHPAIVWDEIVGYLLTMTAAPAGVVWVIAGFLLFRLFDIVKPGPVGWLDRRLHGGLGIMADDLFAGMLACGSLQLIAYLV